MPPTRDDDDEDPQRRPEWPGPGGSEYSRALWRIESKLDDHGEKLAKLNEQGRGRDQQLKEVKDRQSTDAHKAGRDLQLLSGEVHKVQVSVNTVQKQVEQTTVQLDTLDRRVTGVDGRVADLEKPVKEALAVRDRRRAKLTKFFGWAAAIGSVLWFLFEPIWKAAAPLALQRYFHFGPPP